MIFSMPRLSDDARRLADIRHAIAGRFSPLLPLILRLITAATFSFRHIAALPRQPNTPMAAATAIRRLAAAS
jgi:hypothetical protein